MSLVVVVAVSFHSLFLFYYTSAISTMKSPFKPSPLRYMCTNVSILLKIVKDEATGSLCDRNSQGQEENKRIRVCPTNWRYQIALPLESLETRKKIKK